jgi:hypothetical protein
MTSSYEYINEESTSLDKYSVPMEWMTSLDEYSMPMEWMTSVNEYSAPSTTSVDSSPIMDCTEDITVETTECMGDYSKIFVYRGHCICNELILCILHKFNVLCTLQFTIISRTLHNNICR